jgi:UDP-N-acetylmuramoylalanine--D-glutamate ligase
LSGRFAGERAVVLGLGVSGEAGARALLEEGAEVRVTDERPREELAAAEALEGLGATVLAGGHDPRHLDGATLVVASPGVPPSAPVLGWARERGLPVWGELELGARLATAPYLAVTGTNGKSTTTAMIASSLRAAGLDAVACGNVGHPFPAAAREGRAALVVEASSFQLAFQESFRPRVSVLLNLAPDHLDWHGTFEAYAAAKARIYASQSTGDAHVGNRDDAAAAAVSARAPCERLWFRAAEPDEGEAGFVDGELVARIRGEARLGRPGAIRTGAPENAAAAAAAALAFGCDPAAVAAGLAAFEPLPHRGEEVAAAAGVRFVDDSKATNVHAALAAIARCPGAVLIAGGVAKGVDLSPLGDAAADLSGVVAVGEAAGEIAALFEGRVPTRKAGSIEEAVRVAFDLAPRPGTVLLAPACASWDMFRDYAERGERFAAAASAIAGGNGG